MQNSFLNDIAFTWPSSITPQMVWWLFLLLLAVVLAVSLAFSYHMERYTLSRAKTTVIEIVFYSITLSLTIAAYLAVVQFGA